MPCCDWSLILNTAGVSLAMLANAYGCHCHIAMPDDAAQEKGLMLEALGELTRNPPDLCQSSRATCTHGILHSA